MAMIRIELPKPNPDSIEHMQDALQALANACDGANSRDGIGFNRNDAADGHYFSTLDPEQWSMDEARYVYAMLRKYHRQLLDEFGIDYSSIERP